MTDWVRIASTADVAPGKALGLEVMGLSLALCRVGEEPLHAGQFDLRTGAALGDPVQTDLRTFPVRIDGEDVMIALP